MQPLQELLTSLELVTIAEVNEAIFSHQEVGLVEALSRCLGQVREDNILARLADALQVRLIGDQDIEIDQELFAQKGEELVSLVDTYIAIPLSVDASGGEPRPRLAMADPLNQEAIDAFTSLLGTEVSPCLARERAIINVLSSQTSRRDIGSVDFLQDQDEESPVLEDLKTVVEDPEVRKAIQQVTATAVKHRADKVVVSLENVHTQAVFAFEEEQNSSVKISVSTTSFVAGLLRRGQIVQRDDSSFEACCRIEFKSSVVYCTLTMHRGESESDDSSFPWMTLVLSDFSIERPDDPNFWFSVPEHSSLTIRKMFKEQTGMYLIVSRDPEARIHAIQAIAQSYPDVRVVDVVGDLTGKDELFAQAEETRVLIGVDSEDIFTLLMSLKRLARECRKRVRGIVSYYKIPRFCECCAESVTLPPEDQAMLEKLPNLDRGKTRVAKGCDVCDQQHYLGFVGSCSVFDFSTRAGGQFIDGVSLSEVVSQLKKGQFETLWHCGLGAVARGETSVSMVEKMIPRIPQQFLSLLGGNCTDDDQSEETMSEIVLSDPFVEKSNSLSEEAGGESEEKQGSVLNAAPLTGESVFYTSTSAKEDESLDLTLKDLSNEDEPSEPLVKTARTKPLVLVIDDDPDQRAILKRLFEIEGYAVECAADGIDGIVSANRMRPSLVIVDFMMPDLDGRETVRRLKNSQQTADIPIVALTAYPDPDVEYGLLKAGADDFCSKAVSKKVLIKRIERLLGK